MKKFLVVLLSLGLLVAFSATASALDAKFSGSYYVVGVYQNNPQLLSDGSYSHAFFFNRLRFQSAFQIQEGLTLTTRFDALEKQWGNTNWKGGADDQSFSRKQGYIAYPSTGSTSAAGPNAQESIEFERAYVTFKTAIGVFNVGYMNVDDWGTDFGDKGYSRPRIDFSTQLGPMILALIYEKLYENDGTLNTAANQMNSVDADSNTYAIAAIYKQGGIDAGLLYKYYALNASRPAGVKTTMNLLSPYVKATFGPVYVEGEATYWFGKTAAYEAPLPATLRDIDLNAWTAYIKAKANVGPAYFGGVFHYASGNDLSDDTKNTNAPSGGGTAYYNPALILLHDYMNTWSMGGSKASSPALSTANPVTSNKQNTILYNVFGGFNATPKLNLEAALTYATVDKKALSKTAGVVTEAVSADLGFEFDMTATYKLYDNLSYMVGAGYLWTGDYFKGSNSNNKIDNDYILINKLTLSF